MNIKSILQKDNFTRDDIIRLLIADDPVDIELIREKAEQALLYKCGSKVFYRGLVEFSNNCVCDCHYCGIRKSNSAVKRFMLSKEEIISAARWCAEQGYGSVVLQSGERHDAAFVDFVEEVIKEIKSATVSQKLPKGAGVTLSIGEQSPQVYERFFKAGAHRYLLRVESSSPQLFSSIHPPSQSLEKRTGCLSALKRIGFQVGTGVMIGLPGQTAENLADDILFFKKMDVDMIGMGPYIVHRDTPMNVYTDYFNINRDKIYHTSLLMIAVCRLVLKDVNIASTTALQALRDDGREMGLRYGANIIMPQTTPVNVRRDYLLYENKPFLDESSEELRKQLDLRILSLGRETALDDWGDSKHFSTEIKWQNAEIKD
ncbi:MAG: [FeFe] hydrogenase H-cluster radical SAM maturase HydE [Chitinispirillales bacterium]|jgi:biotin synthase|nr:[FeFe] hydrogenase H-cluster radical SAM maturase HydE [Chitinispirillales bacterium]